jgi:AcrR family transcriptional regulator
MTKLASTRMSTKLAQPKHRMSSEERRAAIIHAACRLFAERGFRGTTTRELAAAVGVTEPVLYEHFRTKRDLYSAIIGERAKDGITALAALRDRYSGTEDDRGFFLALGETIINWYTHDPTFIRLLLFSSLEGHELKELFHERSQECFDIVASYIERRIAAQAMRPVNPRIAARSFFGMVAHYALSGLIFGCAPFKEPPTEIVEAMVDIFMTGMSKEDSK